MAARGGLMGFFSRAHLRARSEARAAEAARIKTMLAPLLGLGEGDALSVNEIACADPGCPDVETVVLVMRAGAPTRAFRIRATVEAVTRADLLEMAEEERRQRCG